MRSYVATMRDRLPQQWHTFVSRLKRHALALGTLLFACIVGQAAIATQSPLVIVEPDTKTYVTAAAHILSSFQLFDPIRTPGYPLFLALIFKAQGSMDLMLVVYAQMALMMLAAGEIYVLAYRITSHKSTAAIAGSLVGGNLYILQWERTVLTESLACWLLVTLFVAFEAYLRTARRQALIWLAVLSVAVVLTRPSTFALPPVLFAVLLARDLRLGGLRRSWPRLAIALAAVCGLLFGYAWGNGVATGYEGFSDVSNINLFGKVLQYHMEDENLDPRFAQLRGDLHTYLTTHFTSYVDPYVFVSAYPQYGRSFYALLGDFSRETISQHPIEFIQKTYPIANATWIFMPYNPYVNQLQAPWVGSLLFLAGIPFWVLGLLPFLLIYFLALAWRRPDSTAAVLLAALLLCVLTNIIVSAAGSYGDYYRLREPMDWGIIVAGVITLAESIRMITARPLFGADVPEAASEATASLTPTRKRNAPTLDGATAHP